MNKLTFSKHLKIILVFITCVSNNWISAVIHGEDEFTRQGYYGRSVQVNICGDDDDEDETANKFCICKEEVISCDFTNFPTGDKRVHMHLVSSWETDFVKRICICGAPENLEVLFSYQFLRDHHSVNRIDIYNMEGPINIAAAFDVNFSGDLYIAKIKYLREIMSWGFGRGVTMKFVNTEYLECCSKISSPKLQSPALFIEDTIIGTIRSSGINGQHLWRSVIFNNVVFNKMEEIAISLDTDEDDLILNIAFSNCDFNNLSENSITVNGRVDLLILNSVFFDTCHKTPFDTRLTGESSTMGLIGNTFLNDFSLKTDAKFVTISFNRFKIWDNQTFIHWENMSTHKNRNIHIEFNSVKLLNMTSENIRLLKVNEDLIIFNENLISGCTCSTLSALRTLGFMSTNSTNLCEVRNTTHHCHLRLEIYQYQCSKNWTRSQEVCVQNKTLHPTFRKIAASRATQFLLESDFMNDMIKHYGNSTFRISTWIWNTDLELEYNNEIETESDAADADSSENKITVQNTIKQLVTESILLVASYFTYK